MQYAFILIPLAFLLVACSQAPVKTASLDWNNANYAEVMCGTGGCANSNDDEDNINSIGKGRK